MPRKHQNDPDGENSRAKPSKPSGYDSRVHAIPDDDVDDTDVSARSVKQRRDVGRPGRDVAMKNTDPEFSETGATRLSTGHKHKVTRRDVGGDEVRLHDGQESLRPGTKIETRRIADLVPSPWQEIYDDLSVHDLKALAASLQRHGLRQPVEVLPVNAAGLPADTVMDGCQRLAALKLNGETEVRVLVRYDLAEADLAAIELDSLGANKDRRQLDKLEKARVALRQYELGKNRKGGKLFSVDKEKALELLGNEMGMSGKTLHRHWNVLQTPVEVQRAYTDKKLGIVPAARVATLDDEDHQEIARRIREGEDPKAVVKDFCPTSKGGHVKTGDAVASYVRGLVRGHDDLAGRVDEVRPGHVRKHAAALKRARRLIKSLLAVAEQ